MKTHVGKVVETIEHFTNNAPIPNSPPIEDLVLAEADLSGIVIDSMHVGGGIGWWLKVKLSNKSEGRMPQKHLKERPKPIGYPCKATNDCPMIPGVQKL